MKFWAKYIAVVAFSTSVTVAAGAGSYPAYAQDPAQAAWLDELVGQCPDLYVLGVQGTTESSPDAPVKVDTGMLGTVMAPLLDHARELGASVDRAYVPYPGSFGGLTPGGSDSYVASVTEGQKNLASAAATVLEQCPGTKLAVTGFSQGAHAASNFLRDVGQGRGSVPATAIAAGALFGSPTRAAGSALFPGSTQSAPSAVPGTDGEQVKTLPEITMATPEGAGLGPVSDITAGYGSLSGRVASWCQSGDLACDAPVDAPIARAVVNVAGQAEIGGDPFVAISTIGSALADTAFTTVVDTINQDVSGNSLDTLSISPKKSISQRLAEASDPRATPPTGQEALAALTKVGLIGINSLVTVVKKVLTPETIAAVAAAGLVDPPAAFALLAAKTISVLPELVPPATTQRLVQSTFTIVQNELKANADVFDLAAFSTYRNVVAEHVSYGSVSATVDGQDPTRFVASWLAAAAADLGAASADSTTMSATKPVPTTTVPVTTTSVTTTPAAAPEKEPEVTVTLLIPAVTTEPVPSPVEDTNSVVPVTGPARLEQGAVVDGAAS